MIIHPLTMMPGYLMRVQAATTYDFESRNMKRGCFVCAFCVAVFGFRVSCKSMEMLIDSKCGKGRFLSALLSKIEKAAIGPPD